MAEPPFFFTGRRRRGWQDLAPPQQPSEEEEEEHGRPLTGTGSEMMMTAGSAVGDDPSYPPPVAACYLVPPSPAGRRRPSFRAPAPFSPRSPAGAGGGGGVGAGAARFFCDPRGEDQGRHFLDACAMCRKTLGANRDIFMYRGDVPFCSEECRQEQMDRDEARDRGAMKASARNASSSSEKQQGIRVPAAGAIVAG